jgi:catechol 2,3-dioxygenase-like lactoylglutathione lyase family enzyme
MMNPFRARVAVRSLCVSPLLNDWADGGSSSVSLKRIPVRRIVIDHLAIGVTELERSRVFYTRALEPLAGAPIHVAFAADSPQQVDEFYAAAIAAGGRDNGAPGIRPEYSPGYYGAFVLDPDGNNVEAVHHAT